MIASARLAAASVVAACLVIHAAPALAADLDYPPNYPPRADVPYDDEAYGADSYAADRYDDRAQVRRDYDPYAEPAPAYDPPSRPGVALRDPKSFDEGAIYSRSFEAPPYGRPARYDDCVPRRVVRMRLVRNGWVDFHEVEVRGRVVRVKARSPSGRPFDLTIDRCSGDIVDARPLRPRYFDGFAYDRRPYWRPRY